VALQFKYTARVYCQGVCVCVCIQYITQEYNVKILWNRNIYIYIYIYNIVIKKQNTIRNVIDNVVPR
jgi:hypothetical protein